MSSSSSSPNVRERQSFNNWIVNVFGGRNGWLGYFYEPSVKEEATERFAELERLRFRLEMAQEDKAIELRRLEKQTKKLWTSDRKMEARQAARDLRMGRVEYTRMGTQKANLIAIRGKLEQLRSGTAVEDNMVFFVRAMAERMRSAHPERMAHVLQRCEQLQSYEAMTKDLLEEYFAEEEQAERDRVDEEIDDDHVVDDVLVELGLKVNVSDAPPVPVLDPSFLHGGAGAGTGTGGGGGGAGGAASPPTLKTP